MRILLLNPPNLEEKKVDAQTTPLGLLHIGEYMKDRGFHVETRNLYPSASWTEVKRVLRGAPFDLAGIPCYTRQRFSVFKLAEVCKEINPRALTVLGGPHATFLDRQILEGVPAVDCVVRHEGELTFHELTRSLERREAEGLSNIRGLTYREGKTVARNPPREIVKDLRGFPLPRYNGEQLREFPRCKALAFHFKSIEGRGAIAPILASRGCSHRCLFCCNGAFWKGQHYYAPRAVVEQMETLSRRHGIRVFDFYDDDLLHSREHVEAICDGILERDLRIHWWCSARACHPDPVLLRKMRKAGCFMISYGIESGSQEILNRINKKLDVREAVSAARITREAGLKLRLTVSIGHPGESSETIRETMTFLKEARPHRMGLFLTKLYPGAPLYRMALESGFIDDEYWLDPRALPVPFYTAERSLEEILGYRERIRQGLRDNIIEEYENVVYTSEFDLKW